MLLLSVLYYYCSCSVINAGKCCVFDLNEGASD